MLVFYEIHLLGFFMADPYTSLVEVEIILLQFAILAASKTFKVPEVLVSKNDLGAIYE